MTIGRLGIALVLAVTADAADPCYHPENVRAKNLFERADYDGATAAYQRLIAELGRQSNSDCRVALALTNLAGIHMRLGRFIDSEQALLKAIRVLSSAGEAGTSTRRLAVDSLLALYVEGGQREKAARLASRIEIAPDAPLLDRAQTLNNVAAAHFFLRDFRAAERHYRQCLRLLDDIGTPADPEKAVVLNNYGLLLMAMRRLPEAESISLDAVSILGRLRGAAHPDLVRPLLGLADLAIAGGREPAAEPLLVRALRINEAAYGPGHFENGQILARYAFVLRKLKRKPEAEAASRRATEIGAVVGVDRRAPGSTVDAAGISASWK